MGTVSAADLAAASILRGLLAKRLSVADAKRSWPKEPVSEPKARGYLAYFKGGLDGRGTRDPKIDKAIADLASTLEAGAQMTEPEVTAVSSVRTVSEAWRRLVASFLCFDRTRIEVDLKEGNATHDVADRESARLAAMMRHLFGDDALEPDERKMLSAQTGSLSEKTLNQMHWRIESVGVLAWALELQPSIPDALHRFDYRALEKLAVTSPAQCRAVEQKAKLRPLAALMEEREKWRANRVAMHRFARSEPRNQEALLARSRSLERYRTLVWLTQIHNRTLGETPTDPQ